MGAPGVRRERRLTPEQAEMAAGCMGLCRRLATEMYRTTGGAAAYEELYGDALVGACLAAYDFKPERSKFVTYAYIRIRGTMIDGMRDRYRLTRSQYAALTEDQRSAGQYAPPYSIEDMRERLDNTSWDVADPTQPGVDEEVIAEAHNQEIRECLDRWLDRLHPRQRRVVVLHWLRGMTLAEVGMWCGFTESRACQVERQAFECIREMALAEAAAEHAAA